MHSGLNMVTVTCHVIVRNHLFLSMGSQGVAAGVPALSQGYSLDKSPAHRRALTDEQCGVCSRTL